MKYSIFIISALMIGCSGLESDSISDAQLNSEVATATPTPTITISPVPTVSLVPSPTSTPRPTVAPSVAPTRVPTSTPRPTVVPTTGRVYPGNFYDICARTTGHIKCVGFDSDSEFYLKSIHSTTTERSWGQGIGRAGDDVIRATRDTTIKASGASSLKFEIPSGTGADTSGHYMVPFGKGFSQNSKFYVQFKQRMTPEMIDINYESDGWKQIIFHRVGASCGNVELTTQNVYMRGFPHMYTKCGSPSLKNDLGGGDFQNQQGDYDCRYKTFQAGDFSKCAVYMPNQWITYYYEIEIGDWGQPNSKIRAYIAYEGGPLLKFIDQTAFTLNYGVAATDTYSLAQITPYQSKKESTQVHPVTYTWYDDFIVSDMPLYTGF